MRWVKSGILSLFLLMSLYSCSGCSFRPESKPEPTQTVPVEQEFYTSEEEAVRGRVIADILYKAKMALDDDRLMEPASSSAYKYYFDALAIDQDNEVALAGLEEIASRYIGKANSAIQTRQLERAEYYLDRSAIINNDNEPLRQARQALEIAKSQNVNEYQLDPDALSARNLDIMVQLGEIAELLQEESATFLITARTDEEGRWIYRTMREAVGGRLRGNIALGDRPNIQVNLPDAE